MKTDPFVSVVITTIGKRDSLGNAINSVLGSSYRDFELIVVDDGGKIELNNAENFVLVRQEHKGLAAARNAGIRNSKGKIIAFIDDDAVAEKNWLKEIVDSFSDCDAVSGKTIEYFEDKTSENLLWTCNNFGLIKVDPAKQEKNDFIVLHGCNMAFTRNALEKTGLIDENFIFYFDEIDFSARLREKGFKIKVNEKAVVRHFIKSNKRFGNKFNFGKYKFFFALKNFNSGFFLFFLLLNDFPFFLDDLRDCFLLFFRKKTSFFGLMQNLFFVFAGRISGIAKYFIYFLEKNIHA